MTFVLEISTILLSDNPYSPITHTVESSPRGMGYESFQQYISNASFLNRSDMILLPSSSTWSTYLSAQQRLVPHNALLYLG